MFRFIYFSVTIATSTGSGDILAIGMLPRIIVLIQILARYVVIVVRDLLNEFLVTQTQSKFLLQYRSSTSFH